MNMDKRLQKLEAAAPPPGSVCLKCRGMWINVKALGKNDPDYPCPVCGSPPKTILEHTEPDQIEHMREMMECMIEYGSEGAREEWQKRHGTGQPVETP